MKVHILSWSLILFIFTFGCTSIEKMHTDLDGSSQAIAVNTQTVHASTQTIDANTQAVQRTTELLKENTQMIQKMMDMMPKLKDQPVLFSFFAILIPTLLIMPSVIMAIACKTVVRKLNDFEKNPPSSRKG
jgi:hypothetical protein